GQLVGSWIIGLAGSKRSPAAYSHVIDQPATYIPCVELRIRAGADRLLGPSARLLLGLTTSTFSSDVFTGTGTITSGTYRPGVRFISDVAYLRVIGSSTLTLAAWDFYRLAGDTNSASNPETKENVLNAELRLAHRVAARLQLDPMVG